MKITAHHKYENFTLEVTDLTLSPNRITGLVGKNGAGKSTLMSILSSYKKANIRFDLLDCDLQDTVFIPTSISLYDYLTVGEFVDFVIKHSSSKKNTAEILKVLSLENKQDVLISSLSQGMQKKLTLVPIFVKNYSLIILDEPFNSIDLAYIFQLKQLLKQMQENATIIISSHIIDILADICDDIVQIENGKIVQMIKNTGSVKELEAIIFE